MTVERDTQAERDPFEIILEVGQTLASSLVLEEVLATVARQIGEAMDVTAVDIQSYDADTDELVYEAYWNRKGVTDEDRAYTGTRTALTDRPEWHRVTHEQRIIEQHVDDEDVPVEERAALDKWGYKTTVDAPLIYGDTVFGVLGFSETRFVRHFSPEEHDLFSQLLALAAVAIHNAQEYRAQEERSRRLASLVESSRAITSSLELEEVLDAVTREACRAVGATQGAIYEYDDENDALVHQAFWPPVGERTRVHDDIGTRYALDACPGDRVILESPDIVEEHVSDPGLASDRRAAMTTYGEQTALSVPLRADDGPVGILRLYDPVHDRHFTEGELELLAGLGDLAGAAISGARLHRAQDLQRQQLVSLFETSSLIAGTFDLGDLVGHVDAEVRRVVGDLEGTVGIRMRGADGAYRPFAITDESTYELPEVILDEVIEEPSAIAQRAISDSRPACEHAEGLWHIAVPFIARGKVEGFIEARSRRRRAPSREELELIEIVANQAVVAIENAGLYRRIELQSITDGLTGLFNHRHFYEKLYDECARADRYETPLSLLLLDIDDFKAFNDTYGHPLGDQVLRDVGRILLAGIRRNVDFAARYGGEEFAVILPFTPVIAARTVGGRLQAEMETVPSALDAMLRDLGAESVGERLRHDIEDALFSGPGGRRRIHVTVSMGIAELDLRTRTVEEMVENADKALYLAKRKGKNRIEIF